MMYTQDQIHEMFVQAKAIAAGVRAHEQKQVFAGLFGAPPDDGRLDYAKKHDVSKEARDEEGKWTEGGAAAPAKKKPDTYWMNEWEVEEAEAKHRGHPILGPATTLLMNLMTVVNNNSDGWAYWHAPAAAAGRLMAMIHDSTGQFNTPKPEVATPAAYKAALSPIKAFITRRKGQMPELETLVFPELAPAAPPPMPDTPLNRHLKEQLPAMMAADAKAVEFARNIPDPKARAKYLRKERESIRNNTIKAWEARTPAATDGEPANKPRLSAREGMVARDAMFQDGVSERGPMGSDFYDGFNAFLSGDKRPESTWGERGYFAAKDAIRHKKLSPREVAPEPAPPPPGAPGDMFADQADLADAPPRAPSAITMPAARPGMHPDFAALFAPQPRQQTLFEEGMNQETGKWLGDIPQEPSAPLYVPNAPAGAPEVTTDAAPDDSGAGEDTAAFFAPKDDRPLGGLFSPRQYAKDGYYHGPNAPGPGWTLAGTGPKNGKMWAPPAAAAPAAPAAAPAPAPTAPAPEHIRATSVAPNPVKENAAQKPAPPDVDPALEKSGKDLRDIKQIFAMGDEFVLDLTGTDGNAGGVVSKKSPIMQDMTGTAPAIGFEVEITHPKLHKCHRFIGVDSDNNRFIRADLLVIKKEFRGEGLGTKLFADMARDAKRQGFDYVQTHAAGSLDSATFNGYYTWPLLGYNESIESIDKHSWRLAEKLRAAFPEAEDILDVVTADEVPQLSEEDASATRAALAENDKERGKPVKDRPVITGADWWLIHGDDLYDARFDLAEGSKSWDKLNAYLNRPARAAVTPKQYAKHDVSAEKRDEAGRWTEGGIAGNKAAPENAGMKKVTLYRAADDDAIVGTASFSTSKGAAKQYLSNPGFGGRKLWKSEVEIPEDELLDLHDLSHEEALQKIEELTGLTDPGAIGIDEWVPRIGSELRDAGIEWVRVKESFPEDTETYIFVGGNDPEMEELD